MLFQEEELGGDTDKALAQPSDKEQIEVYCVIGRSFVGLGGWQGGYEVEAQESKGFVLQG